MKYTCTHSEDGNSICLTCMNYESEITSLKAELEAMTTLFNKESDRLNWLDINTSFVADEKYCIGPYKVGELRAMADDGIAADKKHKPTTLRENLGQG